MEHPNLTAYENVEQLTNFTPSEFQEYCEAKLASGEPYADFIRKYCWGSEWLGKICEIGSGSGRLLFHLEREGLLASGIGYELSASRHQFAEKFKEFLHSQKVINRIGNVLDAPPLENYDLVIGIDLVFQLIAPLYPEAQTEILSWINGSLKTGGYLLLELMDFQTVIHLMNLSANGVYHWWEEFPIYDPWEFGLARFSLSPDQDIVWEKRFVKRGSVERSSFTNILKNFSPQSMVKILESAGFSARVFSKDDSGIKLEPGEFIVLAKKVNGLKESCGQRFENPTGGV